MGLWGSGLWGGGSGSSSGTAGTPLSELVMPAYRIAGITQRARIGPSIDMYAEAIPELNRMLGGWNLDGHKVANTLISELPLTEDQKIYTIGSGAELDMPRPLYIRWANILLPTDPVVRWPVRLLQDIEWAQIAVQDIPGAPPYQLYYDGSYDENGYGKVYLRFQPPAEYILELYTWQAISNSFTDQTDVALLQPGYEDAIVYNLAKRLAALNPGMANMAPESYRIAEQSLRTIITYNSESPKMDCEIGISDQGPGRGWLDGSIR